VIIAGPAVWEQLEQQELLLDSGFSPNQAQFIVSNSRPARSKKGRRRTRGGAGKFPEGRSTGPATTTPPPPAPSEWAVPRGYAPPSRGRSGRD
jgi:hypothetical protein